MRVEIFPMIKTVPHATCNFRERESETKKEKKGEDVEDSKKEREKEKVRSNESERKIERVGDLALIVMRICEGFFLCC